MNVQSLKGKLLLGVATLVIGSGLLLSLVVTQHYSKSLRTSLTAQAQSLAHAASLEAAEKILINDVVSLQKLLQNQMSSSPAISYMFVVRDGEVLAHTFPNGVPVDLIDANEPIVAMRGNAEEIASTQGDRYVDIAWPIFEGKAGTLRLGISEKPFAEQVRMLWFEMMALTAGILVLACAGSLLYVRRITRPLGELAEAAKRLDKGTLDLMVRPRGNDEVAALASAFNSMVNRVKDFTRQLEEKTREVERSHEQTRAFCDIVREIGSLPTLGEVGSALIERIAGILKCRHIALLVLNDKQDKLYVASENNVTAVKEEDLLQSFCQTLDGLGSTVLFHRHVLEAPLVPDFFGAASRQAIIPLENEHRMRGVLAIACPNHCECDLNEIDWVSLILAQSAGVVRRALLQEEAAEDLHRRIEQPAGFWGLFGKDPKMQTIYRLIRDIARTDATVLIQGESGTGKELVARAIHLESDRKDRAFVVINCSAYPEALLESELFGHERGAFTGAIKKRAGRFEQADGGTVFLDEIGEIAPAAQVKLLRVLQTQSFERVGGEETLNVNVRVIAATNRDLAREVELGTFREDLFFRLNVIPIHVPPLRDRRNDIPALAGHFLQRYASEQGKSIQGLSADAMRAILAYSWPGNVRELENTIEHGVVLAKGDVIELSDLPAPVCIEPLRDRKRSMSVLEESEKSALERVLAQCAWNKKEAAKRLGIGRTTLYAKLKKYRIRGPLIQ
ncbi:MAG: sigma 54-interacting transcriptional regulator [Thermodesulfobacteriota bacterium]